MENVQDEFWEEDFSMDEEEEYIENFVVDEETQEDMEFFRENLMKSFMIIKCFFSDFESDALIEVYENNDKHMNYGEKLRKIENQTFKILKHICQGEG